MKASSVLGYVLLTLIFSLVDSQQHSAVCTQLQSSVTQLCSGNNNNNHHYQSITTGVPGKRGSKGEKGDSSTYVENEEKYRAITNKLVSLHQQLASVQNENQRLKANLDEANEMCNNKITRMEDKILGMLSKVDMRVKMCGLLHRPSEVEDRQFTASTIHFNREQASAYHGRLLSTSGYGGWLPDTSRANEWLQVDLERERKIYGVVTQGRTSHDQWVTSYNISYKSSINESFNNIEDQSGETVVFQGNADRNTQVINEFPQPITARYFRINPLLWNGFIVIRFDLLTC